MTERIYLFTWMIKIDSQSWNYTFLEKPGKKNV